MGVHHDTDGFSTIARKMIEKGLSWADLELWLGVVLPDRLDPIGLRWDLGHRIPSRVVFSNFGLFIGWARSNVPAEGQVVLDLLEAEWSMMALEMRG